MQISNINTTQTPNFAGRIIFTPQAKRTLKEMSSNRFTQNRASRVLNKLLDAQEHIKDYNWSDIVVSQKNLRLPIFVFSTLLTAPVKRKEAVECYIKNAMIDEQGYFFSEPGDVVKEGEQYDISQAEEQESLEKALEIADINEKIGNNTANNTHSMTIQEKLQKLGIE